MTTKDELDDRDSPASREVPDNLDDPRFAPRPQECLPCYLLRMAAYGCGRHRFTRHYQRLAAPQSTGLLKRLARSGGCCCECEVLWNVYAPNPVFVEMDEDDLLVGPFPTCRTVRTGSTRPCPLWLSRR